MAAISNVKYLTEQGVYDFLHNPNENYLVGNMQNMYKSQTIVSHE